MKITKDVAVTVYHLQTKKPTEKVFAARMKEVQFVGDIVKNININIEREANMKDEHIAQMAKELTEYMEWMTDSLSKEVTDAALDDLIEDSGDVYEVIVDIHLINGDVVTLRNECLISFDEKRYMGANVVLDLNNGNIIADISVCIPYYRSIKIPLTSICWIDSYTESVNWKKYKRRKEIEGITGMRFESYK
nr:MAG TPA: hypothetical protein [Caudoviricetes sp.]